DQQCPTGPPAAHDRGRSGPRSRYPGRSARDAAPEGRRPGRVLGSVFFSLNQPAPSGGARPEDRAAPKCAVPFPNACLHPWTAAPPSAARHDEVTGRSRTLLSPVLVFARSVATKQSRAVRRRRLRQEPREFEFEKTVSGPAFFV